LLLLLLLLLLSLLTAFGTKGDSHRSVFKFKTAVFSVLSALFQVQPLFFCFFLRYWYVLVAVCHAALFCVFRYMIVVLCMIMAASFGCWYMPTVR
jgi:hypothetical protein